MNIVILGASDVGLHVASLFSKSDHNVLLVDQDPDKIQRLGQELDIGYRKGKATNLKLLQDLAEIKPDVLLAVTDSDETNLVSCALAKSLGYPRTIARVKSRSYYQPELIDCEQLFLVDHLINPYLLAAQELMKFITGQGALAVENFAHGSIQMRKIKLSSEWKRSEAPLMHLDLPPGTVIALIKRMENGQDSIIFPHGGDYLLAGDELTLIGQTHAMQQIHQYFGIEQPSIQSVCIVGANRIGSFFAEMLEEEDIRVKIIDDNLERCQYWAERLGKTTVIHRPNLDIDFLSAEHIAEMDMFVACHEQDEHNISACLMAQQAGCPHIGLTINQPELMTIAEKQQFNVCVSPHINAASKLLSLAAGEKISSIVSLYNHQAEIMQMHVSIESPLTGIPIKDLAPHFPNEFLLCVIQNRGRTTIANGSSILTPGDTVIAVSAPKHIDKIKQLL